MASYNGEMFIEKQLRSILCQLSEDDEVIISDDNSSDNTLIIIDAFNDDRIKVSTNTGRSGPVGNFEQALIRANGEYVLLADQDDIWEVNKVDTLRTLLSQYDLVLSDCQVSDQYGSILHDSFFAHRGSQPGFWHNLYKNSYVGCCMAFRYEVLQYVLPFPSQIHMHDWWIGLLVEARGSICFYPRQLIKYVRHGSNASPTGEKGYSLFKRLSNRCVMLLHVVRRLGIHAII